MSELPVAREWTVAKGDRQRQAARCPEHGKETTRFRLAKSEGWLFSCPYGPHNFLAQKPDSAVERERQAKAQMRAAAGLDAPVAGESRSTRARRRADA